MLGFTGRRRQGMALALNDNSCVLIHGAGWSPGLLKRRSSQWEDPRRYQMIVSTLIRWFLSAKEPRNFITKRGCLPIAILVTKDVPLSMNRGDTERFRAFQRSIGLLDLKLQSFANAIRQLGSSVGLLDSTTCIQERLPQILRLFRENASRLFKTGVVMQDPDAQAHTSQRYERRSDSWRETRRQSLALSAGSLNINTFPSQLKSLATDLITFVDRLNDVPEFVDTAVHTTHGPVVESCRAFAGDLQYRADCLSEFEDKLDDIAVVRHINELTGDIGSQADHLMNALHGFIEVGIPAILYSQERTATNLQNLSAVATFFSAVTATTIQVQLGIYATRNRTDFYNIYLMPCGSVAMNAQLAYHLFSYSSAQPPAVNAIVTAFTAFTSFTLLCVGMWFAFERLTYSRTQGRRWLLQIIDDGIKDLWKAKSLVGASLRFIYNVYIRWKNITRGVGGICFRVVRRNRSSAPSDLQDNTKADEEAQRDEVQYGAMPENPIVGECSRSKPPRRRYPWPVRTESRGQNQPTKPASVSLDNQTSGDVTMSLNHPMALSPTSAIPSVTYVAQGERRFSRQLNAIRAGLFQRSLVGTQDFLVDVGVGMPKLRTQLVLKLPSHHIGQVGHLQFSPDGQSFATCSWDRAAYVWKIQNEEPGNSTEFKMLGRLVHPGMPDGTDIGRVIWSPSGQQLVTQYRGSIALWNPMKNMYYQKHAVRRQHVQSVVWMPSGSGFLSTEWIPSLEIQSREPISQAAALRGSELVKFDVTGRQVASQTYKLYWLQVWDLAIMPDEKRVVTVASLVQSQNEYRPINTDHQKRILVYNLETGTTESQMPLMVDVRGIMLGKTGTIDRALVSYENNVPQAWHIEQDNPEKTSRLKLIKTYYPKYSTSYYVSLLWSLQGSATLGHLAEIPVYLQHREVSGEICIWDLPTGNLIHTHFVPSSQEFTGLAQNPKPAGNNFMFASAMTDGTVNIWITATEPTSSTSSNTGSASKIT
ncbi:WD40 repeat protein [Rhizoctonia solani]|uniref:WD40 repeat protein n=1 Tax=Rhizoctonia solani TaxID=456999 RepID=A0A8H8P2T9_9AGAM|nr:WD40 repeat protein [Rhizoctonia solani]QRW23272.1 WD40 repeat protein [Rhizoctonia solani]